MLSPTKTFFCTEPLTVTRRPIEIADELQQAIISLEFSEPVTHVYNPLDYARPLYEAYLRRFASETPREVLLVGMNPGPWGMAQTGVPFGDVDFVGDWMGLSEPVAKPDDEHPKRPVDGLECARNEVSGSRLWGWAREQYGEADRFFSRYYVHNYCPLLFLEDSGRNRTPNKLKADERRELFPPCDEALRQLVTYFEPDFVIGIGVFATKRIKKALQTYDADMPTIGRILHPSPASPKANRGWAEQAEKELRDVGVEL
jgi:single-strand selective monofunctional uracil DNA glycosylase